VITPVKQVIDQRSFTAAHINDSRAPLRGRFLYHPERHVQMRRIPTDLGRLLGTIDPFPMLSRVHALILAPGIRADSNRRFQSDVLPSLTGTGRQAPIKDCYRPKWARTAVGR
jgi:hypothetical protein